MTKTKENKPGDSNELKMKQVKADAETQRNLLGEKYKTKVKVAIFRASAEDEPCVVYFEPASTFTKMQCMDMAMQSPMKASRTLFEATVIKEESDPRVFQQDNDDDFYYLGAIQYCGDLIRYAVDILKKN
jgi:hypothetical protein